MSNDMGEQALAELAKIRAETALIEVQNAKARAENEAKTRLEIEKLILDSRKTAAETRKLDREPGWYPFVAGASTVIAALGLLKVIGVIK